MTINPITMQDTLNERGRFETTTSPRFTNIRTQDVMNQLQTLGWEPSSSRLVRSQSPERRPFAKHLVSLARVGEEKTLGEVLPRINLRNANDGTASFELFAGYYRLVCLNGLMVGSEYASIRIRHSLSFEKLGDALGNAVALTESALAKSAGVIKEWQSVTLSTAQIENLAGFAVGLRWGDYFGGQNPLPKDNQRLEEAGAGVEFMREEYTRRVEEIVKVRRSEDASPSLWHVFNRIQENVIRGGYNVQMPRRTTQGVDIRPRKMRTINSIAQSIAINRKLWDGAEAIHRGEVLPVGNWKAPALLS